MTRKLARWIAKKVQRWELLASLILLGGALATFMGVLFHLIDVGEFRLATLLVAADLLVSGVSSLQEATAEDDEDA